MTDKKSVIDEIDRLFDKLRGVDRYKALDDVKDQIPESFVEKHELNPDDWHVKGFHDGKMCVMDYDESGSMAQQDFDVPLDELSIETLNGILSVLNVKTNMCKRSEPEERDRSEWGSSAFGDPDAPRPL